MHRRVVILGFLAFFLLAPAALVAAAQQGLADLLDEAEPQASGPPTTTADNRRQPPNASDAAKAIASVKEIFAKEYAAATNSAGKSSLARMLLAEAPKTTRPTDQWALLTEAATLLADAGDPSGMFDAIAELEQRFGVDGQSLRLEGLAKVARRTPPESAASVADAAMDMADQLLARKEFASALRCVTIAGSMAGKARSPQLLARTKQMVNRVREQEKAAKKTEELAAKHRANPNDPAACQELGEQYCFEEGDWEQGLPLLSRGSDSELAAIARAELAANAKGASVALADRWVEWADKQRSGSRKSAAQERAYEQYAQAIAKLQGLDRTRVQKRMAELSEVNSGMLAKGSPKAIPGLLMWLDVGERKSLVLAANGQAVPRIARWKDLSGLGNDVIQQNPDQQPFFREGAVQFDGSSALVGAAALRTQALTVLAVFQSDDDKVESNAAVVGNVKDLTCGWIIDTYGGSVVFRAYGENPFRIELNLGKNTSRSPQVALGMVRNSGEVTAQLLGGQVSSGKGGNRVVESPVPIHLGQATGAWQLPPFKGKCYRLVVFSRALEAGEISSLLDWNSRRPTN